LQEIRGISQCSPNYLTATELQVLVLVRVTVNAPLVRVRTRTYLDTYSYSCKREYSLTKSGPS